jgi:pyruvate/2-oxoglutarate dehydrogenase complex dihydrolipoamide dehydrogenase (E3) component
VERFDVIVIGMGPGGEAAASRLLDAGRRVAVIERELIGGERTVAGLAGPARLPGLHDPPP